MCKTVDDDWNNASSLSGYWKVSSLKITCAFYFGMEAAFFALIRYYWGARKPLVGEYICVRSSV
jgi:hypothetical protein